MRITPLNNFQLYSRQNSVQKNNKNISSPSFYGGFIPKFKHFAVASMFLIPTAGFVSCGESVKKDAQGVEYVDNTPDLNYRRNYIDTLQAGEHTVAQGETLYGISRKYGITVQDIQSANKLGNSTNIKPNQVLKLPQTIVFHDIKTISDVSKITGLSIDYLNELEKIENPQGLKTLFYDNNGNPTVGAGHKVLKSELEKYTGREITDEEKYTLLTKDLLSKETKIKESVKPQVYDELPLELREGVFDFAYHRGENAFKNNKPLIDGLNNRDYSKAVANLYKNYTTAYDSKGRPYEKHMSGLCKRSLIRMGNASKIFNDGIPDVVLQSAKSTYEEGLKLLKIEDSQGKFPKGAYPNILAEYQDIAYNLFDGKIGVKSGASRVSGSESAEHSEPVINNLQPSKPVAPAPGNTPVYVNGTKISRSKQQIEADWANNAKRFARPFARPELVLDARGNVSALIKTITPTGHGKLDGKLIIVNQGHGGCCANATNINNTNFDPGCSNAVMEPVMESNGRFKRKNGSLVLHESNVFIGNGGKALEEWKVNQLFANDLIDRLTKSGAKVIFISGEVHNAQNAIRKIERENKVDLFVSLHSNSSETIKTEIGRNGKERISQRITPRGFFIMPNNRNGLDQKDFNLAKSINKNFQAEPWLVGLGDINPKSLGVLSSSRNSTSPVPGVLIETGNLKNHTDVANLNSRDFRTKLIDATYKGIVDYLAK